MYKVYLSANSEFFLLISKLVQKACPINTFLKRITPYTFNPFGLSHSTVLEDTGFLPSDFDKYSSFWIIQTQKQNRTFQKYGSVLDRQIFYSILTCYRITLLGYY